MIHFGLEGAAPLLLYLGMWVTFLASVFWRPSTGIYLLALTLPLQTGRYKIQDYPLGSQFVDIILLGVILGLLIHGESFVPKTKLNRFLLVFAIFCYLSLWSGSYFINLPAPLWIGDERFSAWKNYVEMFLFALVTASAIRDKKQVQLLLMIIGISVLVVNRAFYSSMSSRDLSHFSDQVRDAGPMGYAGVNGLAAFEAMIASFLLGIWGFTKKLYAKAGMLLILATCCYCLLFSYSRGGYLGLLVGLVTVGLFQSRWLLVVAAVVVIGWQTLLPVSVQERITMTTEEAREGQQFEPSAEDRIHLWEDAMDLFKRNPLTGTGFQTYPYMHRIGGYSDTHNYYVKILAEMGILGMGLFLFLLWKLFRSGTDLYFAGDDPFWRSIALGFIALLASIAVTNFFGDRWTYQQVDGYLWILLGCVIRGSMNINHQPEEEGADAVHDLSLKEEAQLTSA